MSKSKVEEWVEYRVQMRTGDRFDIGMDVARWLLEEAEKMALEFKTYASWSFPTGGGGSEVINNGDIVRLSDLRKLFEKESQQNEKPK